MMRVGVIQSNYIPWRGYFDFINSVDLFIFHDDVQYTKGDWRNRNKIKTPVGTQWMTVPVNYRHTDQLICKTDIDYSIDWQKDHLNRFRAGYSKTPHFQDAESILKDAFGYHDNTISTLNVRLIRRICEYFGIKTLTMFSMSFGLSGTKTERLIDLLHKVGADTYLSGPLANGYLDEPLLKENGIKLEYKTYDYPQYQQPWGDFDGNVTILDLMANCGPNPSLLKSLTPNET